jgi:hypothetical protein
MVLEEDILRDRKDALHVNYLSSGMDCGVRAAAVDSSNPRNTIDRRSRRGMRRVVIYLPSP